MNLRTYHPLMHEHQAKELAAYRDAVHSRGERALQIKTRLRTVDALTLYWLVDRLVSLLPSDSPVWEIAMPDKRTFMRTARRD